MNRNNLTKAEFLKLVLPIQGWVARCENLLFDDLQFEVINRVHESYPIGICFTYFPVNSPDFMPHGNGHLMLFQFHSEGEILAQKEKIKRFLKVKSQDELDRLLKEFKAA